nr:RING finger protein unkempt-like isoform X3 [Lepeophtheirus salmonis]
MPGEIVISISSSTSTSLSSSNSSSSSTTSSIKNSPTTHHFQSQIELVFHYKYLKEFRVEQCPLFLQHKCQQHRPFTCFHWHFQNQKRRRSLRRKDGTFNYNADIYCTKYDETTGICPDGDECVYLHRTAGDTERRYHLKYYKTGMCVHDTDSRGFCVKNGTHCAFAHGANDLRQSVYDIRELQAIENGEGESLVGPNSLDKERNLLNDDPKWLDTTFVLANYKTEPCKKPPRLCRQGYACPQYHNNKDKRRSPKKFKYRSTPCPNVKSGDEWGDPVGCESGDSCQYCHTRTEQQFHPEIYKSTKCNDIQNTSYCPRGAFCAFAHIEQEAVSLESSPSPDPAGIVMGDILHQMLPSNENDTNHTDATVGRMDMSSNELNTMSFQNRAPGSQLRNGSITPPFEENGVASPIEKPSSANDSKSLSTSIDSALITPSVLQSKNRYLSGGDNRDALICRGMFSIDNDPTLSQAQRAQKIASLISKGNVSSGTTTNTFSNSGVGYFPSLSESLDSVGTGLEDLNLDPFDCSKSRKSSGFSEKIGGYDVKSRNCSGNSLSAGMNLFGTNGSAPVMIPGDSNVSPSGNSPLHNNFLQNFSNMNGPSGHDVQDSNCLINNNQQRNGNSLGLFADLSSESNKDVELSRLKDELAQTRHKLVAWEEGIQQARSACEAWKQETSMATKS